MRERGRLGGQLHLCLSTLVSHSKKLEDVAQLR